ncbi:MAG: tRNA dihydrouridine synthase DusB [Lentisphaerae bacterium]|nr:tRNA dihydrouridine synthase DusB [Lentisphaerota bacterium]
MNLQPLFLKETRVDFPVALAPMAGFTDAAFRSLCVDFGCGLTLTELTNAAGLVRGSKLSLHMLSTGADERPAGAHIYGADPSAMAGAAAIAAGLGRFALVDINAGCPVRKIVSRGAGVALMREPLKVERMVRAVAEAARLPVTLKTRLGENPADPKIADVARAAEQGGAAAIIVHARFACQRHGGPADWAALARVKAAAGIPVVGNGGIMRAADVAAMAAATGVDGVMIGQAALGNPWIFRQARALAEGRLPEEPAPEERRQTVLEHLRRLIALYARRDFGLRRARRTAEQAAVMAFRGHLVRYLAGLPGWSGVRRSLNAMTCFEDVARAAETCCARDS